MADAAIPDAIAAVVLACLSRPELNVLCFMSCPAEAATPRDQGRQQHGPGGTALHRQKRSWRVYVALGDSLTAGRGDPGPDGQPVGWARRLAGILTERTSHRCAVTNLAVDGATLADVLGRQLPLLDGVCPDLVSATVGMNDIRGRDFSVHAFAAEVGVLLDSLTSTGATVLTCTLPDIAGVVSLPPTHVEIAHQRLRTAGDVIKDQSARFGAVCLDIWTMTDAVVNPEYFTADRLHPNARGHSMLAAAFAGMLLPG